MKKINYTLSFVGLSLLFAACNFNEQNFPGYDAKIAPTNVFAYSDSLTTANMSEIIVLGWKAATNAADSTAMNYLVLNKYFHDVNAPSYNYIPLWLANKYKYGDPKSTVEVTSIQYIADEGETQIIREKYVIDTAGVFRLSPEIFSESFNTNLGKFTAFSKIGDEQKWTWKIYGGLGYAYMNGFKVAPQNNDDWLISPAIDLRKRVGAYLSFDNAINYDPGFLNKTTLWVNDSWDGATLDTLQWVRKEFVGGTGINWTFVNSGPISLTEYAGKSNIRFAFRYESKTTDAKCPGWEVANIKLLETVEE